jgi:hypothetical protein
LGKTNGLENESLLLNVLDSAGTLKNIWINEEMANNEIYLFDLVEHCELVDTECPKLSGTLCLL